MGMFSWTDDELAAQVVELAQQAWVNGQRTYTHRLNLTTASSKNDPDRILTLTIEGVETIGWALHSATPYMQTVGPNQERILLVFTRPEE